MRTVSDYDTPELATGEPWRTALTFFSLFLSGDIAIEGFTLTIIFKNFFSFIITFYALDWMIKGGIAHVLTIISIVQVGICLLTIPMCRWFAVAEPRNFWSANLMKIDFYGKRCRAFFHRHDLIAICRLKELDSGIRSLFGRGRS